MAIDGAVELTQIGGGKLGSSEVVLAKELAGGTAAVELEQEAGADGRGEGRHDRLGVRGDRAHKGIVRGGGGRTV